MYPNRLQGAKVDRYIRNYADTVAKGIKGTSEKHTLVLTCSVHRGRNPTVQHANSGDARDSAYRSRTRKKQTAWFGAGLTVNAHASAQCSKLILVSVSSARTAKAKYSDAQGTPVDLCGAAHSEEKQKEHVKNERVAQSSCKPSKATHGNLVLPHVLPRRAVNVNAQRLCRHGWLWRCLRLLLYDPNLSTELEVASGGHRGATRRGLRTRGL